MAIPERNLALELVQEQRLLLWLPAVGWAGR